MSATKEKRTALHRRLAMRLAETYHGRPMSEEYLFGEATGGLMFAAMATVALEEMERTLIYVDQLVLDDTISRV